MPTNETPRRGSGRKRAASQSHRFAGVPRFRHVLPVILLGVFVLAVVLDLHAHYRTFEVFGEPVRASQVSAIVIEPRSSPSGTPNRPQPPARTVKQWSEVLRLLNLMSAASLSRREELPQTAQPVYTVLIQLQSQTFESVDMYQIHRYPLQLIAIAQGKTFLCPQGLARALKTLG